MTTFNPLNLFKKQPAASRGEAEPSDLLWFSATNDSHGISIKGTGVNARDHMLAAVHKELAAAALFDHIVANADSVFDSKNNTSRGNKQVPRLNAAVVLQQHDGSPMIYARLWDEENLGLVLLALQNGMRVDLFSAAYFVAKHIPDERVRAVLGVARSPDSNYIGDIEEALQALPTQRQVAAATPSETRLRI